MRTVSRVAVALTATAAAIAMFPLAAPGAHAAERVVCGSGASYLKGAPYAFDATFRGGRAYHGIATVRGGERPVIVVELAERAGRTLRLMPESEAMGRAVRPIRTVTGQIGHMRMTLRADSFRCAPGGRLLTVTGTARELGRTDLEHRSAAMRMRHACDHRAAERRRVAPGHWMLRSQEAGHELNRG